MLPNKSYLVKAFYDWIVDSECTPFVVVDTTVEHVQVPENYIENDQIVLNVVPRAIRDLKIETSYLSFDAKFDGGVFHIYTPIKAIIAVYAQENGRGMIFDLNNQEDADHPMLEPKSCEEAEKSDNDGGDDGSGGGKKPGPSHLKVIK